MQPSTTIPHRAFVRGPRLDLGFCADVSLTEHESDLAHFAEQRGREDGNEQRVPVETPGPTLWCVGATRSGGQPAMESSGLVKRMTDAYLEEGARRT